MSSSQPDQRPTLAGRIRRHPWMAGVLAAALVAVVAVVFIWFQPQALFIDRVVDDEFPIGAGDVTGPGDEDTDDDTEEPMDEPMDDDLDDDDTGVEDVGPVALSSGNFEPRSSRYTVEGTATIYQLEDGSRLLRLEDFSSTNGPDLYVYLTSADSADSDEALDSDFVDLGLLSGNIGNQNYGIGDDVDLDHYDTVVIWCRRFTVGFGSADLVSAG